MVNMATTMRSGVALVLAALAGIGGCASPATSQQIPDRTPSWMKYYVAGSRIARQPDMEGNPSTGTYVITITDQQLSTMPGFSLAEKLSGVPSAGY